MNISSLLSCTISDVLPYLYNSSPTISTVDVVARVAISAAIGTYFIYNHNKTSNNQLNLIQNPRTSIPSSVIERVVNKQLNQQEEERFKKIAQTINEENKSIKDIQNTHSLTNKELLSLAPYLTYGDFTGLESPLLQQMLEKCSCLETLIIKCNNEIKEIALPPSGLLSLKKLECVSCRCLTTLPNMPNLTYLNCSKCNFDELPELPNLTNLECYNCDYLNVLPKLPNLTDLDCSECRYLELLPELPNLIRLQCYDTKLTRLPELPNLIELCCDECKFLTELPKLPNLIQLFCSNSKLTKLPELPNLISLNCSNCNLNKLPELTKLTQLICCNSNLTKLPELTNLTYLNCSNCNLDELPKLPNLIKLFCSNSNLTKLPELTSLTYLDCSKCNSLAGLPSLPNLQSLNCNNCESLDVLQEMTELVNLDCRNCNSLIRLPSLPNLQSLNCNNCESLDVLQVMPELVNLDCSNCKSLTRLPLLPNLQSLNCNNCESLAVLQEMPNLTKLKSNNCKSLVVLPSLPNLQSLNCNNCESLRILQEMPRLVKLSCRNCVSLNVMPSAFPNIQELDCYNCPNLPNELSIMLPNVYVNHSINSINDYGFNVQESDIEKNPFAVLLDLGKNHLLNIHNKKFPDVSYYKGNKESEGIDVGGLKRDLVSRLTSHIFSDIRNDFNYLFKSESIPDLRLDVKENIKKETLVYRSLGHILGCCYKNENNFKIGPSSINPAVYTYLPHMPLEQLIKAEYVNYLSDEMAAQCIQSVLTSYAHIVGIDLKAIDFLCGKVPLDSEIKMTLEVLADDLAELDIEDFSAPANKQELITYLLKQALQDGRLHALNAMALGMRTKIGQDIWSTLNPEDMRKKIEGEITKEALNEKINWTSNPSISVEQKIHMTQFFQTWLAKTTPQMRSDFIRAVTGNNGVGDTHIEINIYDSKDPQRLPTSHTCNFSLDFPVCDNQETFDNKIEVFLSYAKGFTAA